MRILLTGANGQLGWELQRTLSSIGQLAAFDRTLLDLADPESIQSHLQSVRPDVVVNAGAYTAVDQAESEPDIAMKVNGEAPGILAEESRRLGALLIHYSTDYIFDGNKPGAYVETDTACPLNEYGRTKLAGERAVQEAGGRYLIFRTSWVYGARRRNFALTILQLAQSRPEMRVVDDQIGAPTWCRSIAEATTQAIAAVLADARPAALASSVAGIYHMSAAGLVSRYEFALALIEATRHRRQGRSPQVIPVAGAESASPVRRPANSVLSNERLTRTFGVSCGPWQAGMDGFLADLARQEPASG